jgi:pimeloyl-ACP methyl ester carboxylesterase
MVDRHTNRDGVTLTGPPMFLTVANELKLDRFAILGYSAGAPYTIACALAFPERLTFVGIFSGVDPAATLRFRHGADKRKVMMIRLCQLAPAVGRWYIRRTSRAKYARLATHPMDLAIHLEAEEFIADAHAEATRNGPHGLAQEWRLQATPSGLDLAGVKCPVHLGTANQTAPSCSIMPNTWQSSSRIHT